MTIPLLRLSLIKSSVLGALVLALVGGAYVLWFHAGPFLCASENKHAKVAFVLEGQWPTSQRTDHALELYRQGLVDTLVISGSVLVFDPGSAAKIYASNMISKGMPGERLYGFSHYAQSTWDEARAAIPRLRAMHVDTVALISSNFHLRRAVWIFNLLAQGKPYFYALTPGVDADFDPVKWKYSREGAAVFLTEWVKMLNTAREAYISHKERALLDTSHSWWENYR